MLQAFSNAVDAVGPQQTQTKQRLRHPKIATALVRLNRDLANHDGCHADLVTPSTSSDEEKSTPLMEPKKVCVAFSSPVAHKANTMVRFVLMVATAALTASGASAAADPEWYEG